MSYVAPSSSFEARCQGFPTGLVGTIGVRILDNVGGTALARATAGIAENPAGSGSYVVTLTAPSASGEYTIFWDTGVISPGTVGADDLTVNATGAPVTVPGGTSFATALELGARLGIVLNAAETTRANILLALATGLIQSETGQTISLVAADVLTRLDDYSERLRLPERPVVSITSISLGGVALDAAAYWLDGDELVRWHANIEFGGSGWGYPYQVLAVTYSHGFATIPPIVKATCIECAVRAWSNPASVQAEQIGNEQTTYGDRALTGLMLMDHERTALNKLLRRQSGTIVLR